MENSTFVLLLLWSFVLSVLCQPTPNRLLFVKNPHNGCTPKNGQKVLLDWKACSVKKYGHLHPNIKSLSKNALLFNVTKTSKKSATICLNDQFVNVELFLDFKNKSIGTNQQTITLETDAQISSISIRSFQGQDKTRKLPIHFPIRNAYYPDNDQKDNRLNSNSDPDMQALALRTPNSNLAVQYC